MIVTPSARAQTPVITSLSAPRQVVTLGQNLTLSATATGATSYAWKRQWSPAFRRTTAGYQISSASPPRDTGWYQVVATNAFGSAASAAVFVNVSVPTARRSPGEEVFMVCRLQR